MKNLLVVYAVKAAQWVCALICSFYSKHMVSYKKRKTFKSICIQKRHGHVHRPEMYQNWKVESRDKLWACLALVLEVEMVAMGSIPEE